MNIENNMDKSRPVTKIINMMKEMIDELTKEGEQDADVYEQMGCWCETNDREKTKAIADGDASVKSLTSLIEELTSTSARLNSEIAALDKEVEKNEEALDSATELRRKQLAEFNAEEKDMLASITSMKGAVVALSKHHESFLQDSSSLHRSNVGLSAFASLRVQLQKHAHLVNEVVPHHERRILDNYFDLSDPSMLQLAEKQRQPQSGEIFGILKAMKESFEKNLAQSQKEETENNDAYEDLKAAKTSEIAAGKSLLDIKTQELADADEKNARSKQSLEDTQETLQKDIEFLAVVKEKCASLDAEYAERTKTRQGEIAATNKALSFLTSDEAHDLFTRTFNLFFLQSQADNAKRAAVSRILMQASKHIRDPKTSAAFSALQARMRNAVFGKVVKDIEGMVDKLVQEKADEIALKDSCVEDLNQNQRMTEQNVRDKADLEAKIDDYADTIQTLTKEITELKRAIAEAQTEFKRAGEDREKQNADYQVTLADQRATQKLLRGALKALKSFYDAALLQSGGKQPEFKSYEKNKKSGGVMGMIEDVISDAQQLEAEAISGEEDAQKAYEDFGKETNESVTLMNKEMTNKNAANAKAKVEKVQTETERDEVDDTLEGLQNAKTDLHAKCDYTLKNFEGKQAARDDEIGALKQAISIFGGASFIQFLQRQ